MAQRWNLSVYRIRDTVDHQPTNFDNVIRDMKKVKGHSPSEPNELDFNSKLYLSITKPQKPQWVEFLDNSFENLSVPTVKRVDGLLLVEVEVDEKKALFAFTFGQGRHLLKPATILRSYGLGVALNAIYTDSKESARVRSVDSKTIADNTFNTRRQADRRTDFEDFLVDTNRDFLRTIVGSPTDSNYWGSKMSGGDSLTANPTINFDELGKFCKKVLSTHSSGATPGEFAWINKLKPINEASLLEQLRGFVVNTFPDNEDLVITVPELIEWDNISHFQFSFDTNSNFSDPEDVDLTVILNAHDKPKKISVNNLRSWKLNAYNIEGEIEHSWSLLKCLSGQFDFDGETYVVSEGDYFLVDEDFLGELDEFISTIPDAKYTLPVAEKDPPEGEYNELAANSSTDYLLLDKRTVRLTSKTSSIEICDVLTEDGAFIHVKRKLGSSSLSHLFAQGSVSADLLLMSQEYRERTDEMITKAEIDRVKETGDKSFNGKFPKFADAGVRPQEHEVVYAVAAKWAGRELVDALPFFSKVNLRRHIEDLTRMGYPVSFARIEATPRT